MWKTWRRTDCRFFWLRQIISERLIPNHSEWSYIIVTDAYVNICISLDTTIHKTLHYTLCDSVGLVKYDRKCTQLPPHTNHVTSYRNLSLSRLEYHHRVKSSHTRTVPEVVVQLTAMWMKFICMRRNTVDVASSYHQYQKVHPV